MSFDPSTFATIGHGIVKRGDLDKEARTRTAVSRAYYALYLSVRLAIRTAERNPTDGRDDHVDHGRLPLVLYSANDTKLEAVAKTLEELSKARRQADYVLDPESQCVKTCTSPDEAGRLLRRSEDAIRRLPTIDFSQIAGKIPFGRKA